MKTPRLYVPRAIASGEQITVKGDAAHHITRVLRLSIGAGIAVFNGEGGEFEAQIVAQARGALTLSIGPFRPCDTESPLSICLAQAVSRGERMTYTIQKAVELGVSAIQPLITQRCGVRLEESRATRRLERWRSIAIGATEQSGRTCPPEVHPLATLEQWLQEATSAAHTPQASYFPAHALRLVLDPQGDQTAAGLPAAGGGVTLLVGPEGGFDAEEVRRVRECGFLGIRLGPRTLRTETAGPIAIALLQARWGDLG